MNFSYFVLFLILAKIVCNLEINRVPTHYVQLVNYLQEQVKEQQNQLKYVKGRISMAVKPNIIIRVPQTFQSFTTTRLYTTNISGLVTTINGQSLWSLRDSRSEYGSIPKKISQIKSTLDQIRTKISDVVRKDSNAVFRGTVRFIGNLTVRKLNAGQVIVNTSTLSPSLGDLVTRHEPYSVISGHKEFYQSISTPSVSNILFNGYSLRENVLTSDFRHSVRFSGPLTFSKLNIRHDLVARNGIRGLNMSNMVPLTEPTISLESDVKFVDTLVVTKRLDAALIGGHNLSDESRRVLTSHTSQYLPYNVTVSRMAVPSVEKVKTINGRDFSSTVKRMVTINDNLNIEGLMWFRCSHLYIGDLKTPKINGYSMFQDFMTTNTPQVIFGPKTFSKMRLQDLNLRKNLNDLPFPSSFVTLTGEERVNSPIVFRDILKVTGNVHAPRVAIQKTGRSLDLRRLSRQLRGLPKIQKTFNGTVFVNGDLIVKSLINNLNLQWIRKDSIHRLQMNATITGMKTFTSPAAAANCDFRIINGYNQHSFATASSKAPISISSPIVFTGPVKILSASKRKLYEIDLIDRLGSRISLYHNGFLDNWIYFENMEVDELSVKGLVNDVSPQSLVFKNDAANVLAPKTFINGAKFNWLQTSRLNTIRFNGRAMDSFLNKRIITSANGTILFHGLVLRHCKIEKLSIGPGRLVNGFNFERYVQEIVDKKRNQFISAPKKFLAPVTLTNSGFDLIVSWPESHSDSVLSSSKYIQIPNELKSPVNDVSLVQQIQQQEE